MYEEVRWGRHSYNMSSIWLASSVSKEALFPNQFVAVVWQRRAGWWVIIGRNKICVVSPCKLSDQICTILLAWPIYPFLLWQDFFALCITNSANGFARVMYVEVCMHPPWAAGVCLIASFLRSCLACGSAMKPWGHSCCHCLLSESVQNGVLTLINYSGLRRWPNYTVPNFLSLETNWPSYCYI